MGLSCEQLLHMAEVWYIINFYDHSLDWSDRGASVPRRKNYRRYLYSESAVAKVRLVVLLEMIRLPADLCDGSAGA